MKNFSLVTGRHYLVDKDDNILAKLSEKPYSFGHIQYIQIAAGTESLYTFSTIIAIVLCNKLL